MKKNIYRNRYSIVGFIFITTLLVRVVYYCLNNDLTFAYVSVSGVPFSDAMAWDKIAVDISEGRGIVGEWSARRALFPMILACFYLWFGHSFVIPKMVNILSSAIAIPFIYLIGEKVADRKTAIVTACALMISVNQLNYSLTVMSEPTGLLFFVVSTYFLIAGIEKKRTLLFLLSGICFGLSNLSRTLTLAAFPGLIICTIYLMKRDRNDLKAIIHRIGALCIGLAIVLTPWIIRQKAVHGIYAISDNSADSFYASTSPVLGIWSSRVEKEAEKNRLVGIKEKHDFYKKEAIKNLKSRPGVFLRNLKINAIQFLKFLNVKKDGFQMVAVFFIWVLFLTYFSALKGIKQILSSFCFAILISLAVNNVPINTFVLFVLFGIVAAILLKSRTYSILLINDIVFISIVIFMTGIPVLMSRLMVMAQWLYYLFFFIALTYIFQTIHLKIILPGPVRPKTDRESEMPEYTSRRLSWIEKTIFRSIMLISASILLFFVASGMVLLYGNYYLPDKTTPSYNKLSLNEINETIKKINKAYKDSKKDPPSYITSDFENHIGGMADARHNGDVVVFKDTISNYTYHIKKGERIRHWSRLFSPRGYERTIIHTQRNQYLLFPGAVPCTLAGKPVFVAGIANVDTRQVYEGKLIIEGIALIPIDEKKNNLDYRRMILATDPVHQKILNTLSHMKRGNQKR